MAEYDRYHRAVLSQGGQWPTAYPLETMLRIHCMQHWYNLSDGAMEDALYEIASMRLFARLSLDSALPDRTTIMNFRLLEQHQLAVNCSRPSIAGWPSRRHDDQGTLVDATIIGHPALPRTAATRSGDASDQERQSVALWQKAHGSVDARVA